MYTLITESESRLGKKVVAQAKQRGHEVIGVDKKNGDYIEAYNIPSFEMVINLSNRRLLIGTKRKAKKIVLEAEKHGGLK